MDNIYHTNGLVTHKPSNPYHGKVFAIQTLSSEGVLLHQREMEFSSQAEFDAALEEVKQYNSEEEYLKAGLKQRLVVLYNK